MLRIKKVRMLVFLMCMMFSSFSVLSLHQNRVLQSIFLLVFAVLLVNMRISKKYLSNNQLYLIYLLYIAGVTFLNHGMSMRLATAIMTGCEYIVLFWGCTVLAARYSKEEVLNGVFNYCACFLIIGNMIVLFTGARGIGISSGIFDYFIGNKFTISYLHMIFLAMLHWKLGKKSSVNTALFFLAFLYSVCICKIIDCNTGIVGCVAVAFFFWLFQGNTIANSLLASSGVYCVFMSILSVSIINIEVLAKLKPIAFIIERVFRRSLTLTGRTYIFPIAVQAIAEKPLFGYGINSTYISAQLGWGNAQNGLLKVLLDYGIIGLVMFFLIIINSFGANKPKRPADIAEASKKEQKHIFREKIFLKSPYLHKDESALLSFLYGVAVCATVEVSFSGYFFLGLALLRMVNSYEGYQLENTNRDKNE